MLQQMTRGDRFAGGGAIALLVSLFLPWFGVSTGSASLDTMLEKYGVSSFNAFKAFDIVDIALLLIAVAVAVAVFLIAKGILDDSFRLPLETVGGIATVIIAWNLFDLGKMQGIGVRYGAYLAFLGGLAIAVGGYFNRTDGVI